MAEKHFFSSAEIAEEVVDIAQTKAASSAARLLALSFLAGTFVAFAANGSTMASYNLLFNPQTYGLGRALAGFVFGAGLMMVLVTGAELFTGNNLMIAGLLERKITLFRLLRNWVLVYAGNFLGAFFIAVLVVYSGLLNTGANDLGGMIIRIAASKTEIGFLQAVVLGVMCNMLVCTAVWMTYGSKDIPGKILPCFFIIMLFVISNFEHSIANMFYIPAGLLASVNAGWLDAAKISESSFANLTWVNFFIKNLLPVTLGNMIGGCFMIGYFYWFSYLKNKF